MARGITGTGRGFDLPGRRLGGFSRAPPLPLLRQNAHAAAERRAQQGALLPTGPRRIGGDSSIKAALSPIQAAAMAAERRLRDEVWCGSHFSGSVAERTDGGSSSADFGRSQSSTLPTTVPSSSSLGSQPTRAGEEIHGAWRCSACTLINKVTSF